MKAVEKLGAVITVTAALASLGGCAGLDRQDRSTIGGAAILMWHDAQNVVVSNNTVSGATTGILIGGGDNYHTTGPNDYTTVHNNIVFDNTYGISEKGTTGVHNSYRNNLVFQSAVADWALRNGLRHAGTVAQAPQFVNYARNGAPDFRLKSSSPAIARKTAGFE